MGAINDDLPKRSAAFIGMASLKEVKEVGKLAHMMWHTRGV